MHLNFSALRKFSIPYESYDIVISLTHDNFGTFGHCLSEIYPIIFLLPKEAIQKGYTICKNAHSFHYDGYSIVGIIRDRILLTVYSFSSQTCMHLIPPSITFARNEIRRILKLETIEPRNYVLFNRLDSRMLLGFGQIAIKIASKHPKVP